MGNQNSLKEIKISNIIRSISKHIKEAIDTQEYKQARNNFMQKAYTYQLTFNFPRPNTYKENETAWQLAQKKNILIYQKKL